MYDFSRCKLCANIAASPAYRLKNTTIYSCATCGFHFIDHLDVIPPENPEGENAVLDQKGWEFIEKKLPANGEQHRKNLRIVSRHCSLSQAECLDIGAGAGLFLNFLAAEGAAVHGIEPQKVFREFAGKKFGIGLRGETIDHPSWQTGYAAFFDVVTLWDVLEHVNFPAEMLKGAYNVVKPGGWLFLDTPCRDSLFYRLSELSYRASRGSNPLFLESLYSPKPFRHKQIFTIKQLVGLLRKTGFSIVSHNTPFLWLRNKIVVVCRKDAQSCK